MSKKEEIDDDTEINKLMSDLTKELDKIIEDAVEEILKNSSE